MYSAVAASAATAAEVMYIFVQKKINLKKTKKTIKNKSLGHNYTTLIKITIYNRTIYS